MFAVIRTGGKQYRVEQGDVVKIEKLVGDPGAKLTFDDVLLVDSGDTTHFGSPQVAGAKVSGTIVEQGRDRKVIVFNFRKRKSSKRRIGHRQSFTRVRIESIALA
jgi:large subunit ribosomal protein L21